MQQLIISAEPLIAPRGWDKRRINELKADVLSPIQGYLEQGYHITEASRADRNKKEWILTLERFTSLIDDEQAICGYQEKVAISVLKGKFKLLHRYPLKRYDA